MRKAGRPIPPTQGQALARWTSARSPSGRCRRTATSPAATARAQAIVDRPGRRGAAAARGDRGARRRGRGDPAHPHALRPRRRGRAARPRDRRARSGAPSSRCRCSPTSCATSRGRASARSSPTTPTTRSRAARRSSSPGWRSTCSSRPATRPGHVTYSIPAEQAVFSGDVLFQGSIGRTDLPGGDHATLMRTLAALVDALPGRDRRVPRPHGHHDDRPRARHEPVPGPAARERADPGAARHVRRAGRAGGRARRRSRRHARRILERAGYARIETPTFEATELFARGVGESTDVVQKEMYTFDGGEGHELTLRPEGTAPVCRAYLEHGMHKLPQPVKLWYLSSFFRRERPQKGRFRQFWQIGAEAIGSDDPAVDAEAILLLAELLEALGCRGVRLRIGSLGTPDTRARLPRGAAGLPARARGASCADEVVARIDLNPLRAFDADDPGTQRVMAGAPRLLDAPRRRRPRALRGRARAARRRRPGLRGRRHARARARLLHAHGVRVHLRRARRAVRRRRRRALRRADRADRRAADAGHRLGGGRRADPAGRERDRRPRAPPLDLYVAYAAPRARRGVPARRRRRRAGRAARLELGGPLAQGPAQAGRPARAPATLPSSATRAPSLKDMETGEQQTVEADTVMHHIARARAVRPPRGNDYRDAWCGELDAARVGETVRVAGWVHRRRDHGGLIFIDLRDRTGHRAARLPPRDGRRRRTRVAERLRAEHVVSRRGRGRAARGGQRQPEPRRRARSSSTCATRRAARRVRDAAVPGRRGRPGRRDAAPAPPRARPAPRGHARRDAAAPHGRARDPRLPQRARLPRRRDADPHALDARGRARLPRPEPAAARATSTRCRSRRSCSSSC